MSVSAHPAPSAASSAPLQAPSSRSMAAVSQSHRPFVVAGGLRDPEGLTEVEELMRLLAWEPNSGPAGLMVYEHLGTGGKRLRARLALASVEALGGERGSVIPWAAACELLHNATLVHDDLQDGDRVRRGQPATWVRHGAAQAVNAGDLMLMLPFLAIGRLPASPDLRWSLAATLATHATRVVRGQAAELALAGSGRIDWESYQAAVVGKTSALFQLPVEGAAIIAGSSPADAHRIASGFRHLGVLFQLQDDVLDLFGDKGRDAPGSDLREGKISALVIEHLALHSSETDWLLTVLTCPRDETRDADVESAIARFRNGGALDGVLARIEREALAVLNSPMLEDLPALQELASDLVDVALTPIEHLRSPLRAARVAR